MEHTPSLWMILCAAFTLTITLSVLIAAFFTPPRRKAEPPQLQWTTAKPTKPGWYWIKAPNLSMRICQVYPVPLHRGGPLCNSVNYNEWLHGSPAYFAGPLAEPTHPKE